MKKIFSLVTFMVLVFFGTIYSQGWTPLGAFPDTTFKGNTGGHGVAVDPDGKVWCTFYGTTNSVFDAFQNIYRKIRVIHVFNTDGTPASFSPIKTITVGGVTDTLYNSSLGLRADNNGNILHYTYDALYRINYQTGAGMNKVQPVATFGGTQPAVDAAGNIYTATVLPPHPIQIWTSDFTYVGNVVDASVGYSRTIEVSPDGNTVYWTGFSNFQVYIYSRADEFSPFALTDSILQGFAVESATWSRDGNLLWLSAGNALAGNQPNSYLGVTTYYSLSTWYAYDPTTKALVDSIKWQFHSGTPVADQRPRGLAFSRDGQYAYVTCFGASTFPAFQKFQKPAVDVANELPGIPESYNLAQNYPNPFTPSTSIRFSIPEAGLVTLRVFNLLGEDVATLVNEHKNVGNYDVQFDASRLTTGVYFYTISVNNFTSTKKMILTK